MHSFRQCFTMCTTLCAFTNSVKVIRSFEKGIEFTNITIFFISGGTDIISCFAGQNPTVPVYRGEIQTRNLGMAVESWNDEGVWGNPFIFFHSQWKVLYKET